MTMPAGMDNFLGIREMLRSNFVLIWRSFGRMKNSLKTD